MNLIVFTDGASRGNPGLASYGFTISKKSGKLLYEEGKFIGVNTNNVAEYSAVLEALNYIRSNFIPHETTISFYMDSLLVVQQLLGKFKIKSEKLKPLIKKIKELEEKFNGISYSHVPREKNKIADGLANLALDSLK